MYNLWTSGYTAFGIKGGETVKRIEFTGMFTGKDIDPETSLTYHWNRWRSEDGSVWLTQDPARDGWNWYGYCGQNPIAYTDPDGESGKLTIYSIGNSLFDGHSWISYTPDDTEETTTYGTWGNNPTGEGNGLFENLEQGYGVQVTRSVQLDDEQEAALMKTISQYKEKEEKAWNLLGPCSKFAQDVWESATGEYLNANTLIIVNNPETLKKSIIKANGNVSNGTLDIPDSSSGASSVGSNSVDRSSGSSSYSVGSTSNVSSDPIYDSLMQ